jgi:phage tail tape-measure protein
VLFVGGSSSAPIIADDAGVFTWDSANNRLGLGTATPLEQLQIHGNGKALLMATASTVAESETYIYFGTGLTTTGQWQRIRYRYGSSDLFFERKDNSGVWSTIMTLDWQKSFVGIGTTTPVTTLEVAGPVTVGSPRRQPTRRPAERPSTWTTLVQHLC